MATITGTTSNDTLSGSSDDDSIYGLEGDDQLAGVGGSDYLEGGDGNNTYIFTSGNSTINNVDSGGATEDNGLGDTLVLANLTASQVTFSRDSSSSDDLLISVNGSTDSVLVKYYFTGSLVSAEAIETIQFADSSSLNSAQVNALTGAVNEAPVATDDAASTNMFTPVTVDVLANDYDPESDTFTVTGISSTTTLGAFTLNGDSTITFTPDGVNTGSAEVIYTLQDSAGNSTQATLTIAVSDGSNVAPIASDDTDSAHLSAVTVDVLGNDSDADGDALSVTGLTTTTTLGGFVVNGDNTVTFTPNGSGTGDAIATYSVDDGSGHSVQAQLTIAVTDSAPAASDDSANTHLSAVTVDVLANDVDADGDSLTVTTIDSTSTLGSFVVNGDNSVTFTPNGSAAGDAVATYTVLDSFGSTTQAQLTVTVTDTAPLLADDATNAYLLPVTVDVLANDQDLDGDTLTVTAIDSSTSLGTFVVNGDNTVTFTANGSGSGDAVALYTVLDSFGSTSQAQLTVTVSDSVLSLADDAASTDEQSPVTVEVLANDTDFSGDALNVTAISSTSSLGAFVVNGDNSVTFTPNGSATGDAVATYTVADGSGNTSQATLTVSVVSNDQIIIGTANADTLVGGSGADSVDGLGGDDTLSGLSGNDTITGGTGADKLYGGDGDDILYTSAPINLVSNGSFETGDLSGWNAYQYTPAASICVATGTDTPLSGLTVAAPTNGLYHAVFDEDDIAAHALVQTITATSGASSVVLSFDLYAENQAGDSSYNGSFDVTGVDAEQFVRIDLLTSGANAWDLDSGVVVNLYQGLISSPTDQHFSFELQSYLVAGQSYQLRFSQASNQYFQTVALDNVQLLATVNDDATDILAGGAGDDTYVLDSSTDKVTELANEGLDTVQVSASYVLGANVENLTQKGTANINGTGNGLDNALDGNSGNNSLQGKAGNDTLAGNAGNDYLVGGAGDDALDGGAGIDNTSYNTASGSVQVDLSAGTASGADGNDSLLNIENITGSAYDDTLIGSEGNNNLAGGQGNDTLSGGVGNDILAGGLGNDTLTGETGNDNLLGGAGDDVLDGGLGTDSSSYSTASGSVQVDLSAATATGADGTDTLIGIENIMGSSYDDTLIGDDGNNSLAGSSGSDTVTGGAGNDYLAGGAGDDVLDGGTGTDTASYNGAGGSVQVDLGAGTTSGAEGTDTLINIENITGSSHNDTLIGSDTNNNLAGGLGSDTLTGGAGNDTLAGGLGNDSLAGGLGNDSLVGGLGNDVLDGGTGIDTISYNRASGSVQVNLSLGTASGADGTDTLISIENISGSTHDDTLVGNSANNNLAGGLGNDSLSGGAGNDYLLGGAGDDLLNGGTGGDTISYSSAKGSVEVDLSTGTATGADGSDTLISIENIAGSSYDDTLTGNSANNNLSGGLGNDALMGGAGNDSLVGGLGNDTLTGDAGNDTLVGGVGDDTYTMSLVSGADSIIDSDSTLDNSDTLIVGDAVAYDQLWFRQVDNNLEVSIIGTANTATISNWYSDSANHIELFTAGGKMLTDSGVESLVAAMAALTPPALGETSLSTTYQDALNSTIAANWS